MLSRIDLANTRRLRGSGSAVHELLHPLAFVGFDLHMIACVDGDARDGADEPVVGERFRPQRVDLIGRHLADRLRGAQQGDGCEDEGEPQHREMLAPPVQKT